MQLRNPWAGVSSDQQSGVVPGSTEEEVRLEPGKGITVCVQVCVTKCMSMYI